MSHYFFPRDHPFHHHYPSKVFTEIGLASKGKCCGNRCRHCPYAHKNVMPAGGRGGRINVPSRPMLIDSSSLSKKCRGADEAGGRGRWDGRRDRLRALVDAAEGASPNGPKRVAVLVLAVERPRRLATNAAESVTLWRPLQAATGAQNGVERSNGTLSEALEACFVEGGVPLVAVPVVEGCVAAAPWWLLDGASCADHPLVTIVREEGPAAEWAFEGRAVSQQLLVEVFEAAAAAVRITT